MRHHRAPTANSHRSSVQCAVCCVQCTANVQSIEMTLSPQCVHFTRLQNLYEACRSSPRWPLCRAQIELGNNMARADVVGETLSVLRRAGSCPSLLFTVEGCNQRERACAGPITPPQALPSCHGTNRKSHATRTAVSVCWC